MSFKEYLKENFKRPSLAEIKQNAKESKGYLSILLLFFAVGIADVITERLGMSTLIPQWLVMTSALGCFITITVWGILDDYREWRLKHAM